MSPTPLLLVMYKPSGAARSCMAAEVARVLTCWNSMLCWLGGADLEQLPARDDVAHIAQAAARRSPWFAEYDVRQWQAMSVDVPLQPAVDTSMPLPDLGAHLHRSLDLRQLRCTLLWLNRIAIEMLYQGSPSFQRHRELLIPRLLDGPAQLEVWAGRRLPLVHATKLLVRRTLGTSGVTNLMHVGDTTWPKFQSIESVCQA